MKYSSRKIYLVHALLFCFLTGLFAAFFHQHSGHVEAGNHGHHHPASRQILSEKCNICDAMQNTPMAVFALASQYIPITVSEPICTHQYDYKGIALILSAGRSPPLC